MTEDPARLAAIDQQLARISDQIGRRNRRVMVSDLLLLFLAVAAVIYIAAAAPQVSRWDLAATWVIVAALAAGGFMQSLMLRSYREQISEMRARPDVPRT